VTMSRLGRLAWLESSPPRPVLRRDAGNWALQTALDRRGLGPVAGVDEAGRGACAGPLVVASCVLRPGDSARFEGLTDSKLMTATAREKMYDLVIRRAVDYAIVVVPVEEVDFKGVHVCNIEGMRRAIARLQTHPGYVLIDGFKVPGLTAPSMPVIKGDQAVACVAAASILAKVTRDRMMASLHEELPMYGFDEHKGYCTGAHSAALAEHGPSWAHRWSFVNVATAGITHGVRPPHPVALSVAAAAVVQNGQVGRLTTPLGAPLGEPVEQEERETA
jgi:ribonuclease HII